VSIDVKAIVGDELMHADQKEKVKLRLRFLPVTPKQRRYLFACWCMKVGCAATLKDADDVATLER